ncbi:aspartate/glutamate racemase family protein [Hoeflea sp. CAU 1731]
MHILVVNSNSSDSITDLARIGAQRAAAPGTTTTALTAKGGPPAIETEADMLLAAVATRTAILNHPASVDGAIIACFSDPGLKEIRFEAPFPVVGIAEAAMLDAVRKGGRFSIVTVAPSSVAGIERLAEEYGMSRSLGGVHALDRGVLESHLDPSGTALALAELANAVIESDQADCIILGGAIAAGGMADIVAPLVPVPVIEGVSSAVRRIEQLLR